MIGTTLGVIDSESVFLGRDRVLGTGAELHLDPPSHGRRTGQLVREASGGVGSIPDLPLHPVGSQDRIVALAFEELEGELLAHREGDGEERLVRPRVDDLDRLRAPGRRDVGEGRVAAGKRLAEWNRKNKEDLLKNKNQVSSNTAASTNKVSPSTSSSTFSSTFSSSNVYGVGAAIVLAGIAVEIGRAHV